MTVLEDALDRITELEEELVSVGNYHHQRYHELEDRLNRAKSEADEHERRANDLDWDLRDAKTKIASLEREKTDLGYRLSEAQRNSGRSQQYW